MKIKVAISVTAIIAFFILNSCKETNAPTFPVPTLPVILQTISASSTCTMTFTPQNTFTMAAVSPSFTCTPTSSSTAADTMTPTQENTATITQTVLLHPTFTLTSTETPDVTATITSTCTEIITADTTATPTQTLTPQARVFISQVYGGGGNSGAAFSHDFIELHNPSAVAVPLDGWSIQYATGTGTTWSVAVLSSAIQPGAYLLIQMASGGAIGMSLPSPDLTGNINMSSVSGKVALMTTTTANAGSCPTAASLVDFVGYGTLATCYEGASAAPAGSNSNAIIRADCADSDNNGADFTVTVPNPRNSAVTAVICY